MQGNVAKVLVCLVALAGAGPTPELEPKSDKKFFKTDYPDDKRPTIKNHFGHPYPKVQDDSRYDKDYTKDENDDGGYWKAQMTYDTLKNKVAKEKTEMKMALDKETEEEKELQVAKSAQAKAERDANAAQKKESAAANDRQDADKVHDKAKDNLDVATEEVEKEVKDLEDCKKQLTAAKAKLKATLAEKEAAEGHKKDKDQVEAAAEKDEQAAQKSAEELKLAMEKEHAEHALALKEAEKEKKDIANAEEDLAAQANKLRKYRRADPDGGVYRSGSRKMQVASALLLAVYTTLVL